MQTGRILLPATAALLLEVIPLVVAHGHDATPAMAMGGAHSGQSHAAAMNVTMDEYVAPPSYFRHPECAGWMYAHIAFMAVGWVFVLPLGESGIAFKLGGSAG